ncbi:hypothetical protein AAEH73_21600, partial [Shewanella algae]|uniref:hypothetical protein n=1 Tax=Shewanella algae TaxID=38313 RepID=UPI00313E3893
MTDPVTRRAVLAGAAAVVAAANPLAAALAAPGPLTAREVFRQIRLASGQPWDPNPTDDRIIFGDRNQAV